LGQGLTSIYGIGQGARRSSREKAGVAHTKKIRDLTEDEINHLRQETKPGRRPRGRRSQQEIQMNIAGDRTSAYAGSGPPKPAGERPRSTPTRAPARARGAPGVAAKKKVPAKRANSFWSAGACSRFRN